MIYLDEFYDILIDRLNSLGGISTMKLGRNADRHCHMITVYFEPIKKEILKIKLSESEGHSSGEKRIHISTDYITTEYGYETFTIADQDIKYIHEKALLTVESLVLSKKYENEYSMLHGHFVDNKYHYIETKGFPQYIEHLNSDIKQKERDSLIEDILKEKES